MTGAATRRTPADEHDSGLMGIQEVAKELGVTMRALRRGLPGDIDTFPQDVIELLSYLGEANGTRAVQAVLRAAELRVVVEEGLIVIDILRHDDSLG